MRNYTGLAVWGCLLGLLALEFIDFDSSSKAITANRGSTQPAPAAQPAPVAHSVVPAALPAPKTAGKARAAGVHDPFSHIRDKRDRYLSFRQ